MANDKVNKTSMCSIVCLEIIDYAQKTSAEQVEIKKQFDGFINQALIDVSLSDRVVVNTDGGVAIACNGLTEDALEDVLFISLAIRDEIIKSNAENTTPLYVQLGISVGSVSTTNDAKKAPTIVGDGIDEARRIMSFANPNQILVSHVYYELISKLTKEISQMFEKYDMHTYEQEIFAVGSFKNEAASAAAEFSAPPTTSSASGGSSAAIKFDWKYVALALLGLIIFFVYKQQQDVAPVESPAMTMEQPVVAGPPVVFDEPSVVEPVEEAKPVQDSPKKAKVTKKKVKPKVKAKPSTESVATKPAESTAEKSDAGEKSGWQTFKDNIKQGSAPKKCTQGEIAMGQCTQ